MLLTLALALGETKTEALLESENKLVSAKSLLTGHLEFAHQLSEPSQVTMQIQQTLIRLHSHRFVLCSCCCCLVRVRFGVIRLLG